MRQFIPIIAALCVISWIPLSLSIAAESATPAGAATKSADSIGAQYDSLRALARNEALPQLIGALTGDAASPEARAFGRALAQLQPNAEIDADTLTDGNPAYWRAVIGDPADAAGLRAATICLHIADGRLDPAMNYVRMFRANGETFGEWQAVDETLARLESFHLKIKARIAEGLALHDMEDYEAARVIFADALAQYPHSAEVRFDDFQSTMTLNFRADTNQEELEAQWDAVRPLILRDDPLFPSLLIARTSEEFFDLSRRLELPSLTESPEGYTARLMEFAEIAFDLKAYGTAAEAYWLDHRRNMDDPDRSADALAGFVICLERLEIPDARAWFPEDLNDRIAAQEQAQQARMAVWAGAED